MNHPTTPHHTMPYHIIPEILIHNIHGIHNISDYFVLRMLGVSKYHQKLVEKRYNQIELNKDLLLVHHRYLFKIDIYKIPELLYDLEDIMDDVYTENELMRGIPKYEIGEDLHNMWCSYMCNFPCGASCSCDYCDPIKEHIEFYRYLEYKFYGFYLTSDYLPVKYYRRMTLGNVIPY